MGMDLTNVAGGTARFSNRSWRNVLKLAYEYGWRPLGTEIEDEWIVVETGEPTRQIDDWNGGYFTNDLQWVTEEDAERIADALEDALEDIPDRDVDETEAKHGPVSLFDFPYPTDTLEFFSSAGKQKIRAFIEFCRAGGFRIA